MLFEKIAKFIFIKKNLDDFVFTMLIAETSLFPFLDISAVATPSKYLKTFKIMPNMLIKLETFLAEH